MTSKWDELLALAEATVAATIAELPPEVRAEADQVPVVFLDWCQDDPELLGQYGSFEEGEVSAARGPILIFLAALEDYCRNERLDFAEEVRVTYLH